MSRTCAVGAAGRLRRGSGCSRASTTPPPPTSHRGIWWGEKEAGEGERIASGELGKGCPDPLLLLGPPLHLKSHFLSQYLRELKKKKKKDTLCDGALKRLALSGYPASVLGWVFHGLLLPFKR